MAETKFTGGTVDDGVVTSLIFENRRNNQPDASSLDTMTLDDLSKLHPLILGEIQQEVAAALEVAKRRDKLLHAVLERRYGKLAEAKREREHKSGVVRFADGGCEIIADVKKDVKWDQGGLRDMTARIVAGNESPEAYIKSKTTLSVSETVWNDWAEPLKRAFEPHRTVTLKPSYTIKLPEGDDQ